MKKTNLIIDLPADKFEAIVEAYAEVNGYKKQVVLRDDKGKATTVEDKRTAQEFVAEKIASELFTAFLRVESAKAAREAARAKTEELRNSLKL